MSTSALIFIGILFLAAALLALVYAVTRAEEGYEDDTGYHRLKPGSQAAGRDPAATGTGNPWDRAEGTCCPLDLGPSISHRPVHQP